MICRNWIGLRRGKFSMVQSRRKLGSKCRLNQACNDWSDTWQWRSCWCWICTVLSLDWFSSSCIEWMDGAIQYLHTCIHTVRMSMFLIRFNIHLWNWHPSICIYSGDSIWSSIVMRYVVGWCCSSFEPWSFPLSSYAYAVIRTILD